MSQLPSGFGFGQPRLVAASPRVVVVAAVAAAAAAAVDVANSH